MSHPGESDALFMKNAGARFSRLQCAIYFLQVQAASFPSKGFEICS